jgi:hypothetical protein
MALATTTLSFSSINLPTIRSGERSFVESATHSEKMWQMDPDLRSTAIKSLFSIC